MFIGSFKVVVFAVLGLLLLGNSSQDMVHIAYVHFACMSMSMYTMYYMFDSLTFCMYGLTLFGDVRHSDRRPNAHGCVLKGGVTRKGTHLLATLQKGMMKNYQMTGGDL